MIAPHTSTSRPGEHAHKFIRSLHWVADHSSLAIRDTWSAIQAVCTTLRPNNNSRSHPRDPHTTLFTLAASSVAVPLSAHHLALTPCPSSFSLSCLLPCSSTTNVWAAKHLLIRVENALVSMVIMESHSSLAVRSGTTIAPRSRSCGQDHAVSRTSPGVPQVPDRQIIFGWHQPSEKPIRRLTSQPTAREPCD